MTQRIFHKIFSTIFVLLCLWGISGCGGGGGGGGEGGTQAPSITSQPSAQSVYEGQAATFGVVASGSAPMSYQWSKNGTAIAGATQASYTTAATTAADHGAQFSVVVSNSVGSVTSQTVLLSVAINTLPAIATQPQSQSVVSGQTATFTVVATGSASMTYAWSRNGEAISGATSASYTTPVVAEADNDTRYAVSVSNSYGSVSSVDAVLTVTPSPVAPTIASAPLSQSVEAGQTATFSVVAEGTAPFTYQWRKNGTAIANAHASSYTTPVNALANSGDQYSVWVSNRVGNTLSASATLTVTEPVVAPSITTQPSASMVNAGETATFSVTAAGTAPLSYQWQRDGVDIAGATSASHTTAATVKTDTGAVFTVKVSNSAGTVTSDGATLTVIPPNISYLLISEVASCYYLTVDCWFELYNPTASPISLQGYQIKSRAVSVSSGISTISTFSLPATSIPSNGYLVVSGNVDNVQQRGTQMIRLQSGGLVPSWTSSGFIELLSPTSDTVDFVRFGTSTQTPTTSDAWSGASVAALPSSASSYNRSIVRPYLAIATTDTHSSADWISVNWSTPAGRNDVPVDAVDADGDGIPDSAEVSGGTFAGMDLYAMGARTGQRDIFVEVDRMNSTDPGVIPRRESLQMVVDAFAAKNTALHWDTGTQFSTTFSTTSFNLGQGSNVVAYEPCVDMSGTVCTANTSTRRSIWDWKDEYLDLRRRSIFHYMLFGSSQKPTGVAGSSGLAETPGNDVLITMGGWGLKATLNKSSV